MSSRAVGIGGAPGSRLRAARHRESHSLHLLRGTHLDAAGPRIKRDRLLIGVLAGAGLFYLLGHAIGLGRR